MRSTLKHQTTIAESANERTLLDDERRSVDSGHCIVGYTVVVMFTLERAEADGEEARRGREGSVQ